MNNDELIIKEFSALKAIIEKSVVEKQKPALSIQNTLSIIVMAITIITVISSTVLNPYNEIETKVDHNYNRTVILNTRLLKGETLDWEKYPNERIHLRNPNTDPWSSTRGVNIPFSKTDSFYYNLIASRIK